MGGANTSDSDWLNDGLANYWGTIRMGSLIKKRRKKIRKHKLKKRRRRNRHKKRNR